MEKYEMSDKLLSEILEFSGRTLVGKVLKRIEICTNTTLLKEELKNLIYEELRNIKYALVWANKGKESIYINLKDSEKK